MKHIAVRNKSKNRFRLTLALILVLVLTGGTYAYTWSTAAATIGIAEPTGDIATSNVTATQPDWEDILTLVEDIELLRPNAVGTYSQTDPVGATPEYACVDEVTADEDSTYVSTTFSALELDTYNIPDHSLGVGDITSVEVYTRSRVTAAGTHTVEVALRTYGTDYFSATSIPTTSYVDYSNVWTTNPNTSSAWTWDEIDALEIGVRQDDADLFGGEVRTTQVYVEVTYEYVPITGNVPTGNLFEINPHPDYTGDLAVRVYLANTGNLTKAYEYLNMELYLEGSVEAGETPNYRLLTLNNGMASFFLDDLTPPSGTFAQTSQADFESGNLTQVEAATSPGDVLLDTFTDNATDSYNDETKIATSDNLTVSGGQVRLTDDAPANWLAGWGQRVKLTIDNNDVTNNLSSFPILVYLSGASGRLSDNVTFVFDELENDNNRKKIALTASDGTTQCYAEIEKWDDASEEAWLWVKVPAVASGADTDLYLYYDKSQADNTAYIGDPDSTPAENVWDSNFQLVTHMQDDPDTSSTRDSTSNDNDGTKTGAAEPAVTTSGQIDDAQYFDGGDDEVDHQNAASLQISDNLTIEGWASPDVTGSYMGIAGKLVTAPSYAGYSILKHDTNYFRFMVASAGGTDYVVSNSAYADTDWHYIVGKRSGDGTNYLYVDGVLQTDTSTQALSDSGNDFRIGRQYADYDGRWWDGIIDEVRLSSTDRSDAWIQASYETQIDDLLDFASEEAITYDSPGTLASINLLSGETVFSIDSFDYNASAIPSGTGLKVQFSTDNTSWYDSAGTLDAWDTMSQGINNIDLSGLGWSGANFYYKMEFTSDGTGTPVQDEMSVNFSTCYTSGNLVSSAYDAGNGIVTWDWGTISFTIDEPSETNIVFQIRTATTEAGLISATWYGPTGTGDTYTTSGTAINPVHDGDRWIQYKAYFIGPGNDTPTFSDISITYSSQSIAYTIEVIGDDYGLRSYDPDEWEAGWTVTPEFYCEVTQR